MLFAKATAALIRGDARRLPLKSKSVHCVITSPPYWGLRDYQTGVWVGGDPECEHKPVKSGRGKSPQRKASCQAHVEGAPNRGGNRRLCRCGALMEDRQVGLEASPAAYKEAMVQVGREIHRVMRDDATFWLVIGDSYAAVTKGGGGVDKSGLNVKRNKDGSRHEHAKSQPLREVSKFDLSGCNLKPKDLVGIPWMVAFALRDEVGFYLRMDNIWNKRSPMSESVKDRPSRCHEYVFLFSKKKRYYYDWFAIREPLAGSEAQIKAHVFDMEVTGRYGPERLGNRKGSMGSFLSGRNKRSVWTLTTEPVKDAHFATYPKSLIDDPVKASTSPMGCCSAKIKKLQLRSDLTPERRAQVMEFLRGRRLV